MKIKALMLAGGLLGVAASGSVALAASSTTTTHKTTTSGSSSSDQNLRKVTIRVDSVDSTNHLVKFTAQVAPEAKVEKNGQPIKIDQLKAGDEVRASFDPKTGEIMKLDIKKGGEKGTSGQSSGSQEKQPAGGTEQPSGGANQ